jgi:hypothetical protein
MKYAVCIPYFGGQDHEHLESCRVLVAQGVQIFSTYGCAYVDMARAALATGALEGTDAEVVMWIDHDILFNPSDVEKMVDHLIASDYDVLGSPYPMKSPKGGMIGITLPGVEEVEFFRPGLVDAAALGMGFTAVKRSCFERLAETLPYPHCSAVGRKVWPFFSHIIDENMYLGEDYSFCARVRKLGMRIGIDLEPRLIHKGSYGYTLEDTAYCVEMSQNEGFNLRFVRETSMETANVLNERLPHERPKPVAAE